MRGHRGARHIDRGAVWAVAPVFAVLPFSLLALFVLWLPIGLTTDVRYWWVVAGFVAAGLLLFVRPFQVLVLTPILGRAARRSTRRG